MKFLQSKLFAAVLGSVLFMLTLAFLTTKGLATLPQHERDEPSGSRHAADTEGASWAFFNPELEQLMSELRSERDAVAAKEKQLNELSSRLRTERAELDD